MQIFPLSEGTFTIGNNKQFIPFDKQKDDLQKQTKGSILVEIQPFVIKTENDIILIDTGLGLANENNSLTLHENLLKYNITPNMVTKVLISHLHKDHAGGIYDKNKQLNFSNAKYYIQKREWEFAMLTGLPSYNIHQFENIQFEKNIIWLTQNKGCIDGYINYEVTCAHSQFHQVFWIHENKNVVFFGGDDAPQLQQMKHGFIAKYDFDGSKASQLRKQWWQQGKETQWQFLFYHDIGNPIWKENGY